jgi:hypothetical protein
VVAVVELTVAAVVLVGTKQTLLLWSHLKLILLLLAPAAQKGLETTLILEVAMVGTQFFQP